MPTWGLDRSMRKVQPWGLSEDLLAPRKTQTDPIHGDIYWSDIETRIIDSEAMQRLRHVKQLGMTLKVYPSAEHSRFTHLLGTVATAQQILDKIFSSAEGPHSIPSLLGQWRKDPNAEAFAIKWGEATVLARLTALLHDLTHVPFGHTIEDDLEVLTPHDRNTDRFDVLWEKIDPGVRELIEGAKTRLPIDGRETSLFVELREIVLDKASLDENGDTARVAVADSKRSAYPFVADVVNNTICADLLDYIARDHYFLGLPFAVGDRFMDHFYVVPGGAPTEFTERLVVRLVRDGEPRPDVRTEILKYLRYRYEETERALYHKTKLAYDAMLGKMLEMWKDSMWYQEASRLNPDLRDDDRSLDASWLRGEIAKDAAARPETAPQAVDSVVEQELERYFTFFGDEGLLEHLIWTMQEKERASGLDEREKGILHLARGIRYRSHYRLLGQFSGANAPGVAKEKYDLYRSAAKRRELERRAARFADVKPAWKIVLWIPSPKMRLKIAEVLVQKELGLIQPLAKSLSSDARPGGDPDAALIVDRHTELWALRIYGDSDIRKRDAASENDRTCDRLLGFLGRELGVPLMKWDGTRVDSLERQLAEDLGEKRKWSREQRHRAESRFAELAASRTDVETYDGLLALWGNEDP